ncbi:MAG: hypothetical protein IT450_22820 [Phycisphaerales bacterium]|nr:hypothetical protein [Phycisphaerales bacterium]
MNRLAKTLGPAGWIPAAAALVLAMHANAQQYSLIDLGTIGGPVSGGYGLNDFGTVVGTSTRADADLNAFVWDEGITSIAPLAGDRQAHAFAINPAGVVVGTSYDLGEMTPHGFSWAGGATSALGNFAPRGVSDAGVVVGYMTLLQADYGWVEHACRWSDGVLIDLGTLGGHTSHALGISPDGRIVGSATTVSEREPHATLWQGGAPIDLGTLGGAGAQAYAMNAAGDVVGWSNTTAGVPHAFLFATDSSGGVVSRTDLGSLPGDYSYAYAVNARRQVVGTSAARAFVWQDGLMTDLNTAIPANLGWRLDAAYAINNAGRIVGVGRYQGFPRAFLLVPRDCPDLDGSGDVGLSDLALLLSHFGTPAGATFADGDLDGDGDVDLPDLAGLLSAFGADCG